MSIHKQDKRIKQKAKAYPVKTLRCLHGLPEGQISGQISGANLTFRGQQPEGLLPPVKLI